MRALDRKLARDLLRMWPQVLAIAAVVAAGIATCVTMLSALASLRTSRDDYYAAARFADVFVSVKRAPESAADRLRAIAGVDRVETRIVAHVTLDVAGLDQPATARLVSIPETGDPALNALTLRRGTYPPAGSADQVLASEAFMNANRLVPGDTVGAIVNGRWKRLAISGVALSPEYVYSIRPGDLFPDDRRYAIFWMRRKALGAAFDLDGAFNDAVLALGRDASLPAVLDEVDRQLSQYGGPGAIARADQTSAWYLDNEFKQLSSMGRITPFIFAGVAAFLLNVVIARLVAAEREQIGVLKAFGYSTAAVAWHYIRFVLAIVVIGVVLGIAAGAYSGARWTSMYGYFFRFPRLVFTLPPWLLIVASAAALVLGVAAGLGAVLRGARVPPAVAMRPPAPAVYRRGALERLRLQQRVSIASRMIARNIERRPGRAALSVVAIALAVAIVIVGLFTVDAVHYLTDVQFGDAQRQDATITFVEPRAWSTLHDVGHLPGVLHVEPLRAVPVKLHHDQFTRRLALTGLTPHPSLARVIDDRLRSVALPPEGIVLNTALAERLRVSPGDTIVVDVLEGARRTETVPVAGLVPEYLGLAAYMDISALNRLAREGPSVNGAYLAVDSSREAALYAALKKTPAVAGVTLTNAARTSLEETISAVVETVTLMFAIFGAAIAFGVIYNNGRIAFAERARELGSLHVLGYSHGEMATVLLGETALLTAAGVPLGVLLGRGLGAIVIALFETELARIPLVIAPGTNATGIGVTLAAAAVSAWMTWRQVLRLDVLAVLKAPE